VNEDVRQALTRDRTIDITTTGRTSGQPRRIEIWFHNIDGAIYITGIPGRRSWYANLLAHPDFTFHLKGDVKADLPAHAIPIADGVARRAIFARILQNLSRTDELDAWVANSPLVEVRVDGA
jgi:deazaflavin-dependent oxidoreductase (nitroreductase family)